MRPASGKTLIATALAKFFWVEKGWRTLIITSRRGLVRKQAHVTQACVGDDLRVGQFGDGLKNDGGNHLHMRAVAAAVPGAADGAGVASRRSAHESAA